MDGRRPPRPRACCSPPPSSCSPCTSTSARTGYRRPHRPCAGSGCAALGVYAQLLLGSWVTGQGAGLAFTDWPLYGGRLVPDFDGREDAALQFAHRTWAYVLVASWCSLAARARRTWPTRRQPPRAGSPRRPPASSFVQIGIGALNIATRLHSAVVTAHLAVATLIWGALVAAWWPSGRRTEPQPSLAPDAASRARPRSLDGRVRRRRARDGLGLRRAHQAAHHRAAAGHDRADDDRGRAGPAVRAG